MLKILKPQSRLFHQAPLLYYKQLFHYKTTHYRLVGYNSPLHSTPSHLDATAFSLARFGQGSGPIHLDEVNCVGTEAMLGDCPANPSGINGCSHLEDAGVGCQSECSFMWQSYITTCWLNLINGIKLICGFLCFPMSFSIC